MNINDKNETDQLQKDDEKEEDEDESTKSSVSPSMIDESYIYIHIQHKYRLNILAQKLCKYIDKIKVIYIGNLPSNLNEKEVKIECDILTKEMYEIESIEFKKPSKGNFGFLSYLNNEQASKAMLTLNGKYLKNCDKALIAQPAKSRNDRILNDKYTLLIQLLIGVCPYDQQQLYLLEKSHRTLYIGNINDTKSITNNVLFEYFTKYGHIQDITINKRDDNDGYAFIIFSKWLFAINALVDITKNGENKILINNKTVSVQPSKPPKNIIELSLPFGLTDYNGYPTILFQIILQYIQNNQTQNDIQNLNIIQFLNNPHLFINNLSIIRYQQDNNNGKLFVTKLSSNLNHQSIQNIQNMQNMQNLQNIHNLQLPIQSIPLLPPPHITHNVPHIHHNYHNNHPNHSIPFGYNGYNHHSNNNIYGISQSQRYHPY